MADKRFGQLINVSMLSDLNVRINDEQYT